MSAARPAPALLSAGAALALALAVPGTALADPGNGQGNGEGRQGQGQGHDHGQGHGQSAPAGQRRSAEPTKDEPAAEQPRSAKADQPRRAEKGSSAPARSSDPAGNNGTIKVDTVPGDEARANRPHPGCAFVLQFFGFDDAQRADITFTGQAPTASAGPLLELADQSLATSLTFTAADLGLVGTPTAAQGWHVKVAVDAIGAPGGAKQKVFWLDCPAETPGAEQPAAEDAAAGGTDGGGTAAPAPEDGATAPLGTADDVSVLGEVVDRAPETGAAADADATGAERTDVRTASSARAVPPALAAALPFAVPAMLPFTGVAGLTGLLAAGLGAVGLGALALRAGRQPS